MKTKLQRSPVKAFIFAIQLIAILAVGLAVHDVWYKILISVLGIGFNFFTCYGKRIGFLMGAAYALAYTAMGFSEQIYATAIFMLLIQVPMAVYTYITWGKPQKKEALQLKKLTTKQIVAFGMAFPLSILLIYCVLHALGSNGPLLDALFFSITLMSCILLACYYRCAYLFVGLSGLAGIVLWSYQMIANGAGASLLVLYLCVFVNSLGAIRAQYLKKV